jgi:hypothetical protein
MGLKSFERWLISITDWPVPFVSVISAAAFSRAGRGSIEGPGEKLKTRIFSPKIRDLNQLYIIFTVLPIALHGQRI